MGMFDKNNTNNNYNKCNCPHCRGGHSQDNILDNIQFNAGLNYDISNEINAVNLERVDPEDLIEQYLEAILECDSPEEVEEVVYEFYDEVFSHALQEACITDIEAKIMTLNMLKEEFDEED